MKDDRRAVVLWAGTLLAMLAFGVATPAAGRGGEQAPATRAVDAEGQGQQVRPAAADTAVPKDLRPLILPRQSEMRLVVVRYSADRATLNQNYLTGMARQGGGGGRGGAAVMPAQGVEAGTGETVRRIPMSKARIARLERFDLDWQTALDALDPGLLSPAGRADLEMLRKTIERNLQELEADARHIAMLSPLVPFASKIVELSEARTRIEDIEPQKAAGIVTALTREVRSVHSRVEAGLSPEAKSGALRVGKSQAEQAAFVVTDLRAMLTEWFNFYNGYDPLFTWWMGLPFKRADEALQAYGTLLAEKVAAANVALANVPVPAAEKIAPAPPPKFPSVPDLQDLIRLPQDEMSAIVERFVGAVRGGRGGRAAQAGSAQQPARGEPAPGGPPARDRAFYQAWLSALRSLDFAKLSRNAQVDYLFIKKTAEQQMARLGVELPANPPRKADESGIQGPARGRQGLIFDLQDVFIPYSPEELIDIAEKEFRWCEDEMRKASRQMGFGDDWKQALEKVKTMHPPPGGQASVVRDLMFDAVDYLRKHDLITVPAVAAESLRMIMMTPERQLVNPFFTGGSQISVSYPTDTMEYEARLQSMRGNNTPFSHATAFHEMIPGHNLVGYMTSRFSSYRANLASTSFWGEGWPLYWEMLLYDIGFHDTPENKVGALFWRMHRCARIIFSLRFHMGEWSPQECIDFLVERVGHERDNATAEVRRSFQGSYPPLYQAAYLLGGLQLRALRREVVEQGGMPQKDFHDEVMRQGSMPIALLRLAIGKMPLTRDTSLDWRFYGEAQVSTATADKKN
ncbi:MAG: DUF885 family protein [Vicinamibacterales bacterium]